MFSVGKYFQQNLILEKIIFLKNIFWRSVRTEMSGGGKRPATFHSVFSLDTFVKPQPKVVSRFSQSLIFRTSQTPKIS
jgi:hypothetical protein